MMRSRSQYTASPWIFALGRSCFGYRGELFTGKALQLDAKKNRAPRHHRRREREDAPPLRWDVSVPQILEIFDVPYIRLPADSQLTKHTPM